MRKINLHNNRMMYDTQLKGYVRLLDIVQALKDGDEFMIVNSSGQDVTSRTIARAFAEHLILPMDVYRNLAQSYYEIEELPTGVGNIKENTYERL